MTVDEPLIPAPRTYNGCAWTVLIVAFIVVSVTAVSLLFVAFGASDEASVASHFVRVVDELAPGTRTIDVSCEQGSSPPMAFLSEERAAVRERLQRGRWHRQPLGYSKNFDGWTGRVALRTDGVDGETIDVTDDFDLDCGDLMAALKDHGLRVRGP